jgi:hypothetical protein
MDQPTKPRNSWGNILSGIAIMLCGLLFCSSGIIALRRGTMIHGNWKYPPMSGETALFAGVAFVIFGFIWLWTCFRKEK